jgi:hypothetical protein
VRMHDLDHGWEQRMLDGLMTNRKGVRHVAEISFNPQETVKQFKAVLEAVPRKAALRVA